MINQDLIRVLETVPAKRLRLVELAGELVTPEGESRRIATRWWRRSNQGNMERKEVIEMKAIIGGKRYDTKTATCVAEFTVGYAGDFERTEEGLYRTPKGTWFTAGVGGARSPYATHYRNESHGGSAIRPLTEAEAREWLEEHQELEALEKYFSSQLEDA